MEDPRQVNQEKSELDISCCLSTKYILPSSLLEDDEDERENNNNEVSLKRNFFPPEKKHSSSTGISVGSNKSSNLVNRNINLNEVRYLNSNPPNLLSNDIHNKTNFCAHPNGYPPDFNKKSMQKLKTFSHVQRKSDLEDVNRSLNNNFANSNTFYSPQMYPSNYQDVIYSNLISNNINNMKFQNLYNYSGIMNDVMKVDLKSIEGLNFTSNPNFGFKKSNSNQLELGNNNFREHPNFHSGVPQGDRNRNYPETLDNFNNQVLNPSKINFTQSSTDEKIKMIHPKTNQGLPLFSPSEPKRNFGYDLVYEMAKMNINNSNPNQNRKSEIVRKQNPYIQSKINPFSINNPTQGLENVENSIGFTQSLTPVCLPRNINTQDFQKKTNPRRLNSHTSKHNMIFDTIMEETTDNEMPVYDGSLHNFLKSIDGNFVSYLKTQKGSRAMQKFMNGKLTPEYVDLLFIRIYTDAKELMTDNYGNYFMQKLIQSCSSNQKILLLKSVIHLILRFYKPYRSLKTLSK